MQSVNPLRLEASFAPQRRAEALFQRIKERPGRRSSQIKCAGTNSSAGLSEARLALLLAASYCRACVATPSKTVDAARQLRNDRLAEQRLTMGRNVDALREFFPHLLHQPWPEELLSDKIVFQDAISPQFGWMSFNAYGKKDYGTLMWFLRSYAFLLCKQTKVEILRMWQPCQECVIVRWSMKFSPRVLCNVYGTTIQIDGVSELKLDRRGRIYHHRVDITDQHKIKFDLNFRPFAKRIPQKAITHGM